MKITFLGGGNMANALVGGLLNTGFPRTDLAVIEINPEGRAHLEKTYSVRCYDHPSTTALDCDVVLLAIKPQQLREACEPLAQLLKQQLVISIAAGIRLSDLSRWLGGYTRLVRTMPNTPALIGAGITGLFALPEVSEAERLGAERILQAVGKTLWIEEEAQIDAITALSGSGPAYVFLFIEALERAAIEQGFDATQARLLAIETTLGAAKLAAKSDEPAAILRERVTSKGGTTEAALKIMTERGFADALVAGAHAARARSGELGELFGKD